MMFFNPPQMNQCLQNSENWLRKPNWLMLAFAFRELCKWLNLASDLITGAWTGAYQQAVLCSNDTDLTGTLAAIRNHHPQIQLGLVAPIPALDHRRIASELTKYTNWSKKLSPAHLAKAQLPERIPGTSIHKPEKWQEYPNRH